MSKASQNMALKITNVFVRENIFNEVPNTPVIPTHFPAARIIKIGTILISSPPLEFDGRDTDVGLKIVLFCGTFSLLTFVTSML